MIWFAIAKQVVTTLLARQTLWHLLTHPVPYHNKNDNGSFDQNLNFLCLQRSRKRKKTVAIGDHTGQYPKGKYFGSVGQNNKLNDKIIKQ